MFLETSDFEKEMYSYAEHTLIQAMPDTNIDEEIFIGLAIFSFDSSFNESLYFEMSCKFIDKKLVHSTL